MSIVWIIIIGFLAGVVARLLSPGPNNPTGFLLTTILGIVGAFVATFLGQTIGWYRADQGAGLIGATVGAILILFIWNRLSEPHHQRPRRHRAPLAVAIAGRAQCGLRRAARPMAEYADAIPPCAPTYPFAANVPPRRRVSASTASATPKNTTVA